MNFPHPQQLLVPDAVIRDLGEVDVTFSSTSAWLVADYIPYIQTTPVTNTTPGQTLGPRVPRCPAQWLHRKGT